MTTTNAQLASRIDTVHQQLGGLVEGQRSAERGRAVLHEKLDRLLDVVQAQAIATAEATKDAALAVSVAAQTRDRIDALDREITPAIAELKQQGSDLGKQVEELHKADTDAAPLLNTIKQARNLLAVLIGIAASSGAGLFAFLVWFNDTARDVVLNWLGLSGLA